MVYTKPRLTLSISWAVLLICITTAVGLLHGDASRSEEEARIAALVRQLGDDVFKKREEASQQLDQLGEQALTELQRAIAGPDPEVRRRAEKATRSILARAILSKTTGMKLAPVERGEFMMGSPETEAGRRPDEQQHKVQIMRAFLLGAYEVAQAQYEHVMDSNPSWFRTGSQGKSKTAVTEGSKLPVESLTWFDAIEFCNRLSRLDGFPPYYKMTDVQREQTPIIAANVSILGGNGYRLPTEAEWEYACRASSPARFHFGNETRRGALNCVPLMVAGGYGSSPKWPELGRTAVVGTYPPSPLGLYDMHGNVAEWCWDYYDKDYYPQSPKADPTGPEKGNHRVLRGGSWLVSEGSCRSASRFFHMPYERKEYAGFRVARTPGLKPTEK